MTGFMSCFNCELLSEKFTCIIKPVL